MLRAAKSLWIAGCLSLVSVLFVLWPQLLREPLSLRWSAGPSRPTPESPLVTLGNHPIDVLIREAQTAQAARIAKQTYALNHTASAYRARRGRHPPPGFDVWWQYAQDRQVIFVEDFWDQIYEDLEPFWGTDPATLRLQARSNADKGGEHTILVRNGTVTINTDWFWTKIWRNMIETVVSETADVFDFPDMNIRTNSMDESRLSVPWEVMAEQIEEAAATKRMAPKAKVVSQFSPADATINDFPEGEAKWERANPYYSLITRTCPPDSPARLRDPSRDWTGLPHITLDTAAAHLRGGFVSNYTMSKLICHQPDVLDLNMALIHPSSTRAGAELVPLFGGSKLSCNSEILLPAPMYWQEEEVYTAKGKGRWDLKVDKATWRGASSGGIHDSKTWRHQHRLRFMALTNTTLVGELGDEPPPNFALPPKTYNLAATNSSDLGRWAGTFLDTGFTELTCIFDDHCPYLHPYFERVERIPMAQTLESRYLPDIDGQSFSGRFRSYLASASLPIKATLYKEWHDSRLMAWAHFVPMDNRFLDFYGIMEYFLGFVDASGVRTRPARDNVAEAIARQGRLWAQSVLRKEDMDVYVFRLLLEYARLQDDARNVLGWVGDL